MRDQTVGSYLDDLAGRTPAPGGGAAAALHAAQAAALAAMVARYTSGAKYAAHADTVRRVVGRADELREAALDLAERDAAAFGAVAAAYRLPRASEADASARSAAIADALAVAAGPPAAVIAVADEVVALAAELVPIGNRNVVTDVAAAADAARAAATTARLNVLVNLGGVRDADESRRLRAAVASVSAITLRADAVHAAVSALVTR
jgi:formiminotetrahydrofolate cyclodeaminase